MNISKSEKAFSSLVKAKLKTFLLNQNTFYFNSKVNSDQKILSLLPRIVESAFQKLDLYLDKIFNTPSFRRKINQKELHYMAKKILFCILDTSGLVAKNSRNLQAEQLFSLITRQFVSLMGKYVNCPQKRDLIKNIRVLANETEILKYFEFYLD